MTGEHYEGGHWLGSFAVYLTTRRGIQPNEEAGALTTEFLVEHEHDWEYEQEQRKLAARTGIEPVHQP